MLGKIKLLLWLVVIILIAFFYWFLPKYSFVQKNPGFCVSLTKNLYYCGNSANLDAMFTKPETQTK